MSSAPILYVEDEEDYQLLVQRILGKAGLDVQVVDTGEAGLAALKQERPKLLILDINLPDANGYDICGQLRTDPSFDEMPILMLTVRRRPDEWLRGFSSGADDYLSKPLNPPELVERVRTALEGRRKLSVSSPSAEYQLIQASIAGNRAAFEVLIQQYKGRLTDSLRAAGRSTTDADDIAAGAFLKAYERLYQFKGESNFYTWLYRIAFNEISHQQRNKEGVSIEELTKGDETVLPAALAESDSMEDDLSKRVLQTQLQQAVEVIPRQYRQVLQWHFIRGLSCESMARRLKIPPGTVMSRLFKAKQLLRQSWQRHSR